MIRFVLIYNIQDNFKGMQVLIKQTISSLRKDLGYDEWDEVNEHALLFQQGFLGDVMEIEDGETFEIPEDAEGEILDDDATYYMNVEIFEDVFEKIKIEGDLKPGIYRLDGDLILFEGFADI